MFDEDVQDEDEDVQDEEDEDVQDVQDEDVQDEDVIGLYLIVISLPSTNGLVEVSTIL